MRVKDRYTAWREPKPHPITGDMLSPGERATWNVMNVYRRWSVFLVLQALTILWWTHPEWFPGGLSGWNYVWSDLAVVVEMLVGIAFLGQSMRDAKIIREELTGIREEIGLLRDIHAAVCTSEDGDCE